MTSLRTGKKPQVFISLYRFSIAINRLPAVQNSVSHHAIIGKLTGYTRHGLNQAIGRNNGRGVNIKNMYQALKNPKKISEQANGAMKYVGENATIILNSEGKVITTYGRSRGPQVWDFSGVVQPPTGCRLPFVE